MIKSKQLDTIKSNRTAPILTALGDLSVDEFMAVYWHRKPLLIRQALKNFKSPVSPDDVLDVAFSDDAQARLIRKSTKASVDTWRLDHAPLDFIPSLKTKNWTVLLQGADTQWDSVAKLLGQFRFVTAARLDDLMISVASNGGGVGPHIDSYDVFLLQAHGQRHWRWGKPRRSQTALQANQPLRILKEFTSTDEAILGPGDILYLPPGWAHDGVAQGVCMTFSIGFRSATRKELTGDFLGRIASDAVKPSQATQRLQDISRTPSKTPAALTETLRTAYSEWLLSWRPSQQQIDQFLGEHLSEPRANVVFDPPSSKTRSSAISMQNFVKQASQEGLYLHRSSRALYDKNHVFLNGEAYASRSKLIRLFFNQLYLKPTDLSAFGVQSTQSTQSGERGKRGKRANNRPITADWEFLLEWYGNGWLNIGI